MNHTIIIKAIMQLRGRIATYLPWMVPSPLITRCVLYTCSQTDGKAAGQRQRLSGDFEWLRIPRSLSRAVPISAVSDGPLRLAPARGVQEAYMYAQRHRAHVCFLRSSSITTKTQAPTLTHSIIPC